MSKWNFPAKQPVLTVSGVDELVRVNTAVPVSYFGGTTLPFADATIDAVLFVYVLHHTDDPMILLR